MTKLTPSFSIGSQETDLVLPNKIKSRKQERLQSGTVYDSIFGCGVAFPSTFTLSGKSGTGKTTLVINHMQKVYDFYNGKKKIALLTNEMSVESLAEMCKRLNAPNIHIAHIKSVEKIVDIISKFDYVVIDSIQGVFVDGVSKAKMAEEATNKIVEATIKSKCVVGIIVHLTKSGSMKGNSSIGHIVDCNIMLNRANPNFVKDVKWEKGVIAYVDKNRNGPSGYIPMRMDENGVCPFSYYPDCDIEPIPVLPNNAIIKG